MKKEPKLKSNLFINWLQLMVLMTALWFVLSGIFEIKFICYGVGTCLIVSLVCFKKMVVPGRKTDTLYHILDCNWLKMIRYLIWLIIEIIKANIYVAGLVLFHRDKLNPQIVWFKADYDNPCASVLLANSITITPGTITISIEKDGVFAVHAISDELVEGLLDGGMQAQVAKTYGEVIETIPLEFTSDMSLSAEEKAKLYSKRYMRNARKLVDRYK